MSSLHDKFMETFNPIFQLEQIKDFFIFLLQWRYNLQWLQVEIFTLTNIDCIKRILQKSSRYTYKFIWLMTLSKSLYYLGFV